MRFDYVIVLDGHAAVGLKDLRRNQGSFFLSMMIDATCERPTIVVIPPGVAHGIYARNPLTYLYGLTVSWDGTDEDLGCRYDDRTLALGWPATVLSPRDAAPPDFAALLERYEMTVSLFVERANVAT